MQLFHLTSLEAHNIEQFIKKPPTNATELLCLNAMIFKITQRVGPLYEEGQGMAPESLDLIDRATARLAEMELSKELSSTALSALMAINANFLSLNRGNETKY
jgi:hypothetical protein